MISMQDMPLSGERSPLNVRITGTIQRDGYRIEKLYYESLPGLYVPANLYIPDNINGKAPANIEYIDTPGGHSYHKDSREKIFSFFSGHLMGKSITPEEAGDIDTSPASMLSEEELKAYTEGPPSDDRTTTIHDSFVKLASNPRITTESELNEFRNTVKDFLLKKSFKAFPENPPSFDSVRVFRTLDRAEYGSDIYSFVPEAGWRLNVDIRWRNDPSQKKPLMIVLRNPNESRWESEGFIENLDNKWNIAYFEVRGVGEFGWDPNLQWHVRRASAWLGRTLASMQVYDLTRCIEFCRTLDGVNPDSIGIAAREDMGVVALYGGLLDGKCKTVILKNPPATQDMASSPDGRGAATEILNCLRITDVCQLPALVAPAEIVFIGNMPETYKWAEEVLTSLGKKPFTKTNTL